MFRPKPLLLAGVAPITLAGSTLAEELRGRVVDSFGAQVVIEDRGTRYLMTFPRASQHLPRAPTSASRARFTTAR
ncbi:MAG: hypothetical protein ACK4RN_17080 [Pseudorhodobacter sp.]